jgi:hypothetical protein
MSLIPPAVSAAINTSTENTIDQRIILGIPNGQSTIPTQQPKSIIISPDNNITPQSLPNNIPPFTSLTLSPTINNTLNRCPPNQFSFTASNRPNFKQPNSQPIRPIKTNPHQKLNRTGHTRTRNKPDLSKPDPNPTQQQQDSMEIQTEKKRRREMEKEKEEHPTVIQHFLTAGPGSQDCRDQ